jgi:mannose-6-phosphate isomerase-like protein (cupin superfamily)
MLRAMPPQIGATFALTDHERLTLTRLDADLLEVEAEWSPSDEPRQPLPHRHPNQDEHFVVHEGELTARIDGVEHVVRAGETIDVPAGAVHAMWSTAPGPTRATWQVRPALRTAEFWQAVDEVRRGVGRMPTPEEGQAFLKEYAPEFELVL